MLQILETLTVIIVAAAMAQGLVHALQLPGKLRLARNNMLQRKISIAQGFT